MHGRMVVEKLVARGGDQAILDLMRRFRLCFVKALGPKHLPKEWKVSHEAARDFGEKSIFAPTG